MHSVMTCQVSLGVKLFFNFHLIQQISRSGIFVHDEENVADVDNDTALVIGEILDVAADSFPPVEWVVVLKATGIFPSEVL